jgi:putative ABC transport system permease protein
MDTPALLDSFLGDLRYAKNALRKSPGFTATAILTLALGVGANVAIFSLVNTVLLRDLPFREPDRLVALYEDFRQIGGPATVEPSPGSFIAWRAMNQRQPDSPLEDIAAMNGFDSYNLTGQGEPERLAGVAVTGNLHPLVGVTPILGRTLLPADDKPETPKVVVVSEGLWRRRFGGDPSLVGKSISLNGAKYEVVGVISSALQFPTPGAQVWVPLIFAPGADQERFSFVLTVVGRLRQGVRLEQADATLGGFAHALLERFPQADKIGTKIVPLHDVLTTKIRPTLMLLLATVAVVLLIACANVAQLLMARGAGRHREIALRAALGAHRRRIIRQLLTESSVLAGFAALIGIGVAISTFWFLARLLPDTLPSGTAISIDLRVAVFAVILTGITTAVFGVAPAFAAAARSDTSALLRRGTAGAANNRLRGFLTASEVGLTVVLLIGAGLLLRSLANLRAVNPGFATSNLLVVETVLPASRYSALSARMRFVNDVLDRTSALPGVISAGYTSFAPLTFKGGRMSFLIEGRPDPRPGEGPQQLAVDRVISSGFFTAMGIPILRGRSFDRRDTDSNRPAIIISQAMARMYWPGSDPVGARIRVGGGPAWLTIIGVAADSRQVSLDQAAEAAVYFPVTQGANVPPFLFPRHLVIRTIGDPTRLASEVRQIVSSADPDQPISKIETVNQILNTEVSGRNTQLILVAIFAALALALAAVGLYGVLSYAVARSAPEIGIRMALGAQRSTVVTMVLKQTTWWAGAGLAAGLIGAVTLGRSIQPFLYQTKSTDPLTFAGVSGLVVAIAVVASWLPAVRAASIDPMKTLRME